MPLYSKQKTQLIIDSDIKGVYRNDSYRGLSCLCLEALGEIAANNDAHLTVEAIANAENFVFSSAYVQKYGVASVESIDRLLNARPKMKVFHLDKVSKPFLSDT